MKRARLVCVGAACIDTILTVPKFPTEDSKLRATASRKRRGGNTPNTLEVLQQFVGQEQAHLELFLIATLPGRDCVETKFIASSFDPNSATRPTTTKKDTATVASAGSRKVNVSHSIYREDHKEAVSAYIFDSEETSSRTIVNHNALPEMTFDEFVNTTRELLKPVYSHYKASGLPQEAEPGVEVIWFHFEGRIPETTLACMQYLRNHSAFQASLELRISIELEKPGREGLQSLVQEADVVFYSKAWASGEGYENAELCLQGQAGLLENRDQPRFLISTWGEKGASALMVPPPNADKHVDLRVLNCAAYRANNQPIVDSTGAGDTFIAGMLFGFLSRHDTDARAQRYALERILYFANRLAGEKILQQGFQGLAALQSVDKLKQGLTSEIR